MSGGVTILEQSIFTATPGKIFVNVLKLCNIIENRLRLEVTWDVVVHVCFTKQVYWKILLNSKEISNSFFTDVATVVALKILWIFYEQTLSRTPIGETG